MKSFGGSLANGVLTDAILIPPRLPVPPTNIRKVRGLRRSIETSNPIYYIRCCDG